MIKQVFLSLVIYSHVAIVVPLIVKELFNALSKLNVDALVAVESL